MALVQFTTPPSADIHYVKSDIVASLSPAYAWSDSVQARDLVLSTGERIPVEDTDENVSAARRAIDPTGGAVIVET